MNRKLNPLTKIKPQVLKVNAYTLSVPDCPVKINQNENPFDLPQEIKDEVLLRLKDRPWSRYPTFVPHEMLSVLANFAGWQADGVLAGNGSNELIQALLTVTISPGVRVVISEPTFTLYRLLIEVLGGEVISVPLTPSLQYDTTAIIKAAQEFNADLVICCSPNNPTGCRLSDDELTELLNSFDGLVVIDEAYHEFSRQSVVPFLAHHNNLIVLRTFSKAMALAGLRIGYLLTDPLLACEIAKAKLPYNLNFFSMMAAMVAIEKFHSHLQPLIDEIINERERLFNGLKEIAGLDPVPSTANFIVTKTIKPTGELMRALIDRGILARDVSRYPMLEQYIRFSVGTSQENNLLLNALKEIYQ